MAKRLIKNISAAGVQTVAQTVALIVLYHYLVQAIGIDQIGTWAIVMAAASVARISELGMTGSVTRFVAAHRAENNHQAAKEIVATGAISLGAVLALVLAVAYPGLAHLLPHILPDAAQDDGRLLLPYALSSLWFSAVGGTWLGALDGCLRSDLRAGLAISATVAFLVCAFTLIPVYGLEGLAIAQLLQSAGIFVIGWMLVRRVMPTTPIAPVHWTRARFREMIAYGMGLQFNAFVMLMMEPFTKIILGRYGDLAAAGYFELAQRLVTKVRALIVESNRVVVPALVGIERVGYDPSALYAKNLRFLVFLVTPIFAALLGLIPVISQLWIGRAEFRFVLMGIGLTGVWYVNCLTAPAYFAYLGNGKLRWVTISHAVMGVSNVMGAIIFGSFMGWLGVFFSFCFSLVLGSLIPLFTYHRENPLTTKGVIGAPDLRLGAFCFGAAIIVLLAYWIIFDGDVASAFRKSVLIVSVFVAITWATWRHPMRLDVQDVLSQRMRSRPGKHSRSP